MFYIFDLDGTVIDSTHRQATLADGSLDLDHWFEHNVPEKIMGDSLLPLARLMREAYAMGFPVVVCTARAIQPADKLFLALNHLPYHVILHREIGDMSCDADLKERLLQQYFIGLGYNCAADAGAVMFDDNKKVIQRMREIGVIIMDANEIYR